MHSCTFSSADLPSGVYIYRIIAGSIESEKIYTESRKMLLLK